MTFWQKHKWKILAPVLIVLVLAAAFIFGDRNMPKQKDPLAQPTVAAPVETPAQNAAESNTPDKVETEPTQTPTESTPESSDDSQTDKPARADTEPPEYLSPEEIQASATGEYEEVGGMMIDTGTANIKSRAKKGGSNSKCNPTGGDCPTHTCRMKNPTVPNKAITIAVRGTRT